MNLDDALDTFLEESREMLEAMETLLLELGSLADDPEQLNALFRCVHTIKGSAGLFALDHVVAFTHVVENVLDRLRDGQVTLDRNLVRLLLQCRDHIVALIAVDRGGMSDELAQAGGELLLELADYQAGVPEGSAGEGRVSAKAAASSDESAGGAEAVESAEGECWNIAVRFGDNTLRNGMDPIGFIRYLGSLGDIATMKTRAETIPAPEEMDPESCYLGFDIGLDADTDQQAIEDVFEFVRDDCQLSIVPPGQELEDYIALTLETEDHQPEPSAARLPRSPVNERPPALEEKTVQPQLQVSRPPANQYIRVQADKLDALINLVGELVIAGAAAELSARNSGDTVTQETMVAVSDLVEQIRDGSLNLRMVPIGETFQRFQRVVHDVSQQLGKDIRLEIGGADTELDKTVVEKIADPLTHLVRNAMDHGIESADQREASGKPVQGRVRLNAFHEAGSIVIEVSDDGAGLHRERILARATQKGIVQGDAHLSDQEVFLLVFEPGFSTAEAVTNLSGRGVGMDVVKRSVEALRGNVDIDSERGVGTTVRIRLPLTLAIIDGFLTGVGGSSYVVPLDSVVECVELDAAQREEIRGREFLNLRGEVLPFIRLRDQFHVDGEVGRRENVVVVSYGGHKAGLIVDDLLGEHQTVIKPPGRLFQDLSCISGFTILGSGEVALILDVPSLVQRAVRLEGNESGKSPG